MEQAQRGSSRLWLPVASALARARALCTACGGRRLKDGGPPTRSLSIKRPLLVLVHRPLHLRLSCRSKTKRSQHSNLMAQAALTTCQPARTAVTCSARVRT